MLDITIQMITGCCNIPINPNIFNSYVFPAIAFPPFKKSPRFYYNRIFSRSNPRPCSKSGNSETEERRIGSRQRLSSLRPQAVYPCSRRTSSGDVHPRGCVSCWLWILLYPRRRASSAHHSRIWRWLWARPSGRIFRRRLTPLPLYQTSNTSH